MGGYVILGFLAAFGALCALWVLLGGWLTGCRGGDLIIRCAKGTELAALRRYRWLQGMGLVHSKLIVLDNGLPPLLRQELERRNPDVEFIVPEQLTARLKQGAEEY